MKKLGSYELTGHLTSQNSGYSIWGFGKKNGKDYFLKQFLSPKFPENDTVSSPARLAKIKKKCERFEQKKAAIYKMINDHSDGNAVRVEEFFRVESKYYISMRKIEAIPCTVEMIASLTEREKRYLCAVIAHGIAGLHKGRVVHADLKHDNILFMRSPSGNVTAKIIDFDSGFLETDPPVEGEEIIGDQVYFSPEACQTFMGGNPELTCKMDVFALGVLFHQYFSGTLPAFDPELGGCAGEVVAKGGTLTLADNLSAGVRKILTCMLDADPHKRPSAMAVYAAFSGKKLADVLKVEEEALARILEEANEEKPVAMPTSIPMAEPSATPSRGGTFFTPGDL